MQDFLSTAEISAFLWKYKNVIGEKSIGSKILLVMYDSYMFFLLLLLFLLLFFSEKLSPIHLPLNYGLKKMITFFCFNPTIIRVSITYHEYVTVLGKRDQLGKINMSGFSSKTQNLFPIFFSFFFGSVVSSILLLLSRKI